MSVLIPPDFDLAQTLDCGQAFRWREKEENVWEGVALGRRLELARTEEGITLSCSGEELSSLWTSYFDLEEDYGEKRRLLSSMSPALQEAAEFAPGIRILRQEPFEALCSFLISQNNNVPRIKGIIHRLCELLGEPIGENLYAFPTPEAVAACTPQELAPIRAGFRAKYLVDGARRVVNGQVDFSQIAKNPTDFGRAQLQTILGVGPKVAECVLLYGFHKTDCFPMDVWMKRAMETLLPHSTPADFGENAGLAQQYLFHYSRMHPELFKG